MEWRHAHAHLGYYGVLFPLTFVAWRSIEAKRPIRPLLVVYAAAVLVATFGFLDAGYSPPAHAGSAVVLVVWLHAA